MEWFKHDVDSLMDERFGALVAEYGADGYAVFFHSIEVLYRNNGQPLSRLSVKKIAADLRLDNETVFEILDYACSSECDNLLIKTEDGYSSERVNQAFQKQSAISEARRIAGRRGGSKHQANQPYSEAIAKQMLGKSEAIAKQRDRKKEDICSFSSPIQEENLLFTEKSKSNKPESTCAELPQEAELNASDPVFLTIISNTKEEVPVTESFVRMLEETYPAVNVRSELKAMKAWCISNPKNRKTKAGIKAFINNWLKRDQDRTGRIPQHSYDTIRGTNIRMSLVADGTRPEYPEEDVRFE